MDLEFDLAIAGQSTLAGAVQTSLAYAQPVLATFEGDGSRDAETPGGQTVVLRGNNFGPMDVDVPLNATYQLDVAAVGGTTFNAVYCTLVEAHVTIECTTAPGAGRGLAWKIVVDSQPSRSPTTNYEIPVVEAVVRQGAATAGRVEDASVDGGDTFELHGRGFGSPDLFLVNPETGVETAALQSVTYGPTGTEYTPRDIIHVSHTLITVRTEPGWAQGAFFRVEVAGQASGSGPPATSNATFDFAQPLLVSMSPATTASTASPANAPQIVRLITRSVSLRDRLSRPVVVFGGLVIQPVSAVSNGDGTQAIAFNLPEHGGGFVVPVRIGQAPILDNDAISEPYPSSLSRLSDPFTFFQYEAPSIDRLVVTRPAWTEPGYVANALTLADNNCTFGPGDPFTCSDTDVLQVLIVGTGFSSPQAFRQADDVRGLLRADTSMLPINRYPLHVRSHTHNRILAFTNEQTGTLQVQVSATLPMSLLDIGMTGAVGVQAG